MIVFRRVRHPSETAVFNSSPRQIPFNVSKSDEQKLLDTLNNAQTQGQNVNDPRVLMALVEKSGGAKKYPMFYVRRRRTKTGKVVVEQVRR